jgi:LmbE family N-acetylglucosaminyl deacetylase
MRQVVAVSPHPDDAEYGVGGILAGLALLPEVSTAIAVFELSPEMGDPAGYGAMAEARRSEAAEAAAILGATPHWVGPGVEPLVRLLRTLRADLVLTVEPDDVHPHHRQVTRWVEDAVFLSTLFSAEAGPSPPLAQPPQLAYMESFSTRGFKPDLFVDVSPWFVTARQALLAHRTGTRVCPGLEHQMRAVHARNGAAAAVPYAEGLRLARGYGQDWAGRRAWLFEILVDLFRKAAS